MSKERRPKGYSGRWQHRQMQQLHEKCCGNALHCQKELENGKRWTDQGHGVKEEKIYETQNASHKSERQWFEHVRTCSCLLITVRTLNGTLGSVRFCSGLNLSSEQNFRITTSKPQNTAFHKRRNNTLSGFRP